MRDFFVRVLINAIAIAIAAWLLPGIHVNNELGPLLLIGVVITIVNAFLKPLLVLLTCPAVLLTLGLFILVINGLILQAAAYFTGSAFEIDGLGWAILAGIIMAIVNMMLEGALGVKDDDAKVKR